MKLKCKKCGNEWEYNGSNPFYATCTRCLTKVKVEVILEDVKKND